MLDSSVVLYLLTPTMVSTPASILAWRFAADSSIRIFGIPFSMAAIIPPFSVTS